MTIATADFATWLEDADIAEQRLTPQQQAVLQSAFRFRQRQGSDYFSTRLLGHFLLHADTGLKVAQVARLVGISRPTASCQQGLSSKQVIQQAHHRLRGRPYGKLLPRFAGPIAGFLLGHPNASRADLLDFIEATFGVRVSRIALYKFLKKFGLDQIAGPPPPPSPTIPPQDAPTANLPPAPVAAQAAIHNSPQQTTAAADNPGGSILLPGSSLVPMPPPPPPFSSGGRSTPAPSC